MQKRKAYILIAYNGASYEDAEYKNVGVFTKKRDAILWLDNNPLKENYLKYFNYGGWNYQAKYIIEDSFLYE